MDSKLKRLITLTVGFIGLCIVIGLVAQLIINKSKLPPTESQAMRKGQDVTDIKQQMENPQSISDVQYLNFDYLKTIGLPDTQLTSIRKSLLMQFPKVRRYELVSSSAQLDYRQIEGLPFNEFSFDFKVADQLYTAKGSYQSADDLFIQFYLDQKLISASPYSP